MEWKEKWWWWGGQTWTAKCTGQYAILNLKYRVFVTVWWINKSKINHSSGSTIKVKQISVENCERPFPFWAPRHWCIYCMCPRLSWRLHRSLLQNKMLVWCFIPHSCVLILVLTNFLFLKWIHSDGRLNRNNLQGLNRTVVSFHSISDSFCDEEALPPLLLSLAYPGAYPLEKTDELVKAVWGKEEARASSHFSAGGEREKEREGK